MSLPFEIPINGITATAVVAGLYMLSLLLSALTSPPPPKPHFDAQNNSAADWQFNCK